MVDLIVSVVVTSCVVAFAGYCAWEIAHSGIMSALSML